MRKICTVRVGLPGPGKCTQGCDFECIAQNWSYFVSVARVKEDFNNSIIKAAVVF